MHLTPAGRYITAALITAAAFVVISCDGCEDAHETEEVVPAPEEAPAPADEADDDSPEPEGEAKEEAEPA